MTYPTEAVSRLTAWNTDNFDTLPQSAIIEQFTLVSHDLSAAVTFVLDEVSAATGLAAVVVEANAERDAAAQHALDADAARLAAVSAKEAAEAAQAEAEAAQAVAEGRRDAAILFAQDFSITAQEMLYGSEANPWQ